MRMVNTAMAGFAVAVLTGSTTLLANGEASAQRIFSGTDIYHGNDSAHYDNGTRKFTVGDEEKDGHPVYVYFENDSWGSYYYDRSGAGSTCTTFAGTDSGLTGEDLGLFYICEEQSGSDGCRGGLPVGWTRAALRRR